VVPVDDDGVSAPCEHSGGQQVVLENPAYPRQLQDLTKR